jgi:hypothetical protein
MDWPIKLYYVYYLPHARDGAGKVGMTGNRLRERITDNRKSGLDVTGWRILYATYDFHAALRAELEWQIALQCIETRQSAYVIEKQSDSDRVNYSGKTRQVRVTNIRTNITMQFASIRECEEYFGYKPHTGYISNKLKRNTVSVKGRLKDLKFDIYLY